MAGTAKNSWAAVTLEREGQVMSRTGQGGGPVAAVFSIIDFLTGATGKLLDYSMHSVTQGTDAVGEVFVHVEFDEKTFTGRAASTDIVEASARAYLHAVNKAVHARHAVARTNEPVTVKEKAFSGAAD